MQADKAAHLTANLAEWVRLETHEQIERTAELTPPEVASLIGMGPSSHHPVPVGDDTLEGPARSDQTVTFAFDIFGFRRR